MLTEWIPTFTGMTGVSKRRPTRIALAPFFYPVGVVKLYSGT
jgi:hypothetical protein